LVAVYAWLNRLHVAPPGYRRRGINALCEVEMNVNRLYILRIVADDSDGMVQHSAQGLFYKNVARNGTRIVHWYDVPEHGAAVLRLQYVPG
jgi:hypothetical protein